jgi:hypothetical protein
MIAPFRLTTALLPCGRTATPWRAASDLAARLRELAGEIERTGGRSGA